MGDMTPKQAYKILTNTPIRAKENHTEYSKALHLAIGALEKQIPKMAKNDTENEEIKAFCGRTLGFCPVCDNAFECYVDDRSPYCPECGQALDWSDTE